MFFISHDFSTVNLFLGETFLDIFYFNSQNIIYHIFNWNAYHLFPLGALERRWNSVWFPNMNKFKLNVMLFIPH